MLVGTFLMIVAAMALFPQTPAARWLRRTLIEAPAAKLNTMSARKAAITVVAVLMLIASGPLLPAELALLLAGDMLAYLEIAAVVSLITAHMRLRNALRLLTASALGAARRLQHMGGAPIRLIARRARRARRAKTTRPAARPGRKSKDEGGWEPGWAFA